MKTVILTQTSCVCVFIYLNYLSYLSSSRCPIPGMLVQKLYKTVGIVIKLKEKWTSCRKSGLLVDVLTHETLLLQRE